MMKFITRKVCATLVFGILGIWVMTVSAQDSVETAEAVADSGSASASYRVSAGDSVKVAIYDEPELSAERVVDDAGMVSLPLIDMVKIIGKTAREIEGVIEAAYISQEYLRHPQATVVISGFTKRSVSVLGQVGRPGLVVIPDGAATIDLLSAVAGAGGFKGIANKRKVKITSRKDGKTKEVNVYDLMDPDTGATKGALLLEPGDVIYVPQRIF